MARVDDERDLAADEHRGPMIAAALEQALSRVVERLHATAQKRQTWQQSVDKLLQQSGHTPRPQRDAGSMGVLAVSAIEAAAACVGERLGGAAGAHERTSGDLAARAVAAATPHVRGKTGRGIVRDYDRLFLTARNCLLEHLPPPPDTPPQAGAADAPEAAAATPPPAPELEGVMTLAETVLKEERGGGAALDRLLRDFDHLLDQLTDAAARDVAYAVLANLVLLLLIRLVRELVEELMLISAGRVASRSNDGSTAAAHLTAALAERVRQQKMPDVVPLLRIVTHGNARAQGSHRAKSPTIARLERHQIVVFLEKRKKWLRAWWIEPGGAFRLGWIKAGDVKEM